MPGLTQFWWKFCSLLANVDEKEDIGDGDQDGRHDHDGIGDLDHGVIDYQHGDNIRPVDIFCLAEMKGVSFAYGDDVGLEFDHYDIDN